MKKRTNIINAILLAIFGVSITLMLVLLSPLLNGNTIFSYIVLSCVFVISVIVCLFIIIKKSNKLFINNIYRIITTILIITVIFSNILIIYVDNSLSKINDRFHYYESAIVVLKKNNLNLSNINNKRVGLLEDKNDIENYILPKEILSNIKYDEYSYTNMTLAINDLLNEDIDVIGISSNFIELYYEYFENDDLDNRLEIIATKKQKKEKEVNLEVPYERGKPFTILFIGADSHNEAYNADSLILASYNPNTNKIVMVDIVRDTYVLNKCNNNMDKITHIGWSRDMKCKLDTVSNLFGDIEINYYIKTNFTGLKEIVDLLGGIEIDVPYNFSANNNGKIYTINKGKQILNGQETLTLARVRKLKNTSLFSRGKMQMLIIETLIKEANMNFVINNFFDLFDTLSNNLKTNINKKDIYYLTQKLINNQRNLTVDSYQLKGSNYSYYHSGMKRNLYTYKPNINSVNELTEKLKSNLE